MLWERAKNFMLLFFVLLNVLLAWFLYREDGRYTVTPEQERAVYQVLRDHRVSLYSRMALAGQSYRPMRPLLLSGFHYDTDELVRRFFNAFDSAEELTRTDADGQETIQSATARLTVSNGYITFERFLPLMHSAAPAQAPIQAQAEALAADFLREFYPGFTLDGTTAYEGGLSLCYRQVYDGRLINGNFIEFFVTEAGIARIETQYGQVLGYGGPVEDICMPDVALLSFVRRYRGLHDAPVVIHAMDLVYDQAAYSSKQYMTLRATPYYRVFVENQTVPFRVNAFTGECVD